MLPRMKEERCCNGQRRGNGTTDEAGGMLQRMKEEGYYNG
jgi:hypothetical protein